MTTRIAFDIDLLFNLDEVGYLDETQAAAPDDSDLFPGKDSWNLEQNGFSSHKTLDFDAVSYSDLPYYYNAERSCDRCRSFGLECFTYELDGSLSCCCFPCGASLSSCSFGTSQSNVDSVQGTTLHNSNIGGEDRQRDLSMPATHEDTASDDSVYSHSLQQFLPSSKDPKFRRRRQRLPCRAPYKNVGNGVRPFQCTFCTESFKTKYDWLRHEKSLHLSLEKWICAPLGGIIEDSNNNRRKCVYCGLLSPSEEHLATHNHSACLRKTIESRTFYRKDHFRQHMRLTHNSEMTASMNAWKSNIQFIKSRCGFCGQDFTTWQQRAAHLAMEFRNGANMKNWKGCRGLDAHVAAHVTNAMPPYLIAGESKTPFPFSASSSSCMKQSYLHFEGTSDISVRLIRAGGKASSDLSAAYQAGSDPKNVEPIVLFVPQSDESPEALRKNAIATSWEVLTLRLGRFARVHAEKHGIGSVTDEMLKDEARLILYGENDGWAQTAADNAEWLNLFKQAHGIGNSVPVSGIKALHELFEDLGIHTDSILDTSFDVNKVAYAQPTQPDSDEL